MRPFLSLVSHLTCPPACPGFRLRQAAHGSTRRGRGDAAGQPGHLDDVLTDTGHVAVTGEDAAAGRDGRREDLHQRHKEVIMRLRVMSLMGPN